MSTVAHETLPQIAGYLPVVSDTSQERVLALVRERLGVEDDVELAVKAGLVPKRALNPKTRWSVDAGVVRKVRYWSKGAHEMPFNDAMQILASAGLLSPELEETWRGN